MIHGGGARLSLRSEQQRGLPRKGESGMGWGSGGAFFTAGGCVGFSLGGGGRGGGGFSFCFGLFDFCLGLLKKEGVGVSRIYVRKSYLCGCIRARAFSPAGRVRPVAIQADENSTHGFLVPRRPLLRPFSTGGASPLPGVVARGFARVSTRRAFCHGECIFVAGSFGRG